MSTIERRLERLERRIRPEVPALFVWLNPGETEAEALHRRFPDSPPAAGQPITFLTWLPWA